MFFSFSFVTKETILNELRKCNPKKVCHESDIPVKIIKENLDIVSNFVYNNFSILCLVQTSHHTSKMQILRPFLKRKTEPELRTIDQEVFCLIYRKYMKGVCTLKFMNT